MSYSHLNHPQIVSNVDKLVRATLDNQISFKDIRKRLNELYQPFMKTFDGDLFYAKTIDTFISITESIVGDSYCSEVFWDHEKTQQFIEALIYYKSDINNENEAWCYQEIQNKKILEHYIRCLTTHYSKLLFVSVDLKYVTETSHLVTIDDFNNHMKNMRDLISNKNTCFEHLQGYAWALEQGGESGGLHCHLLLIYDGSERQKDRYLGQEVGEKWQDITGGLGTYFNWNTKANKRHYEEKGLLGIGMIHRDDPIAVENAVRTALYLTKVDKGEQQLKLWLPNMRTFGRGQFDVSWRRGIRR